MWILDLFASAGFGSLLGAVIGHMNKREDRATLKLTQDHEIEKLKAKTQSDLQLADKQLLAHQVKGELKVEHEEVKAFSVSQITTPFGEAIRAIVRPLITLCLLYISYQLLNSISTLVNGLESLNQTELMGLYKIVILQIFGLTGVCIGWWFSTRTSKGYDKLIGKYM